ncbi:hypothetical protein ETAA8_26910 [Anatilimnocola aggregata]|uniref:Uncharacterized protein n=1 Tax=Anatilimnocola aggregata TaxID=2528021 RepID=A0A517YBG9_9BACT|nr:hypothetical protein [Anatilimnocola aggregata]QDU27603.1 hypothetical protein ETAA8_26910 [Anatilimnocola aggregata]
MIKFRWQWTPLILVATGAVAIVVATIAARETLGWWQLAIYLGIAAVAGSTFWLRRQLSADEQQIEQLRQNVAEEEARIARLKADMAEQQALVQKQFEQQASQLDVREQALAKRLLTFHEWMEFPEPLSLASGPAPAGNISDLVRKDRQLMELLKQETQVLYDNIISNKYLIEGQFQPVLVRDDAHQLVLKVARLYQPSAEQPLLEVSLDQIVRASSRGALNILIVLDQLPVSVKDYNLSALYQYVRRAVEGYRLYRKTEPYWPYVNTAYYLSRFAMGANPLALGAWWVLGSIGRQGATVIAQQVVNRQALALLSSVVRVIGCEVAAIYGGDFRHRDANWIYGAELTELISAFPLSREGLSASLKEIGALQFRCEYDRLFLYRCLAAHQSAQPQKYHALDCLLSDERHAIATRLEKFLDLYLHGRSPERIATWKQGVEARLQVKLTVGLKPALMSVREQLTDAVRSLASYLVGEKELEPEELPALLSNTRIFAQIPDDQRESLLAQLLENPPYFFEHPDLDPDSDLVGIYLDDLAALDARVPPHDVQREDSLFAVAAYLRKDAKTFEALLTKQRQAYFAERLHPEAPLRRAPAHVMRAVLDLLAGDSSRFYLFHPVTLEWPDGQMPLDLKSVDLWLLGTADRLILFSATATPQVLWSGDHLVQIESVQKFMASSCKLTGGDWLLSEVPAPLAIRLPVPLMNTSSSYFRPLFGMLRTRPQSRDEVESPERPSTL